MELNRNNLWDVGAHFGHHRSMWNPKMKKYIYGTRRNLHILDLKKTLDKIKALESFMQELATTQSRILFVGTKLQAQWVIQDAARRSGHFYVTERWLGGTLTNLSTIQLRIKRLWEIVRDERSGKLKLLPKKEQLLISKERAKLEKLFTGIKGMRELPKALFVIDANHEKIAVTEARKLNIPVIGLCDTNSDPDLVDYLIPANDDFYKSIALIVNYLVDYYGECAEQTYEPPQPQPEDFVVNNRKTRIQKTAFRHISQTRIFNRNNGYEPIVPLNVNKMEFLRSRVKFEPTNYQGLLEAGRNTATAIKAEKQVQLKPGQKVITFDQILEAQFLEDQARKAAEAAAATEDTNPSVQDKPAPPSSPTKDIAKPVAVEPSAPQSTFINEITVVDNNLDLTLSSLLMKDLRKLAHELNVPVANTKSKLIERLSRHLAINNDKIVIK